MCALRPYNHLGKELPLTFSSPHYSAMLSEEHKFSINACQRPWLQPKTFLIALWDIMLLGDTNPFRSKILTETSHTGTRESYGSAAQERVNARLLQLQLMEISSSYLRKGIHERNQQGWSKTPKGNSIRGAQGGLHALPLALQLPQSSSFPGVLSEHSSLPMTCLCLPQTSLHWGNFWFILSTLPPPPQPPVTSQSLSSSFQARPQRS